ncbi:hypothetical protein BPAE_0036g00380 [Botrytis paeoniae]|uniref:Uncharacterized protein n=1 Tax=Botrytis paeoniae TaxID=278948 RepID=A0A4Z1G152_9HELO|nr:hypothetical protein BPAE_0036g00380 [Botrytis paeoniae]
MTRKKADSNASTQAIHDLSDTGPSDSDSSFVAEPNKSGLKLKKMSRKSAGEPAPPRQKDPTPKKG